MGYNLALNMRDNGFDITGYDIVPELREKLEKDGVATISDLEAMKEYKEKKIVWVMLPDGKITDSVLDKIKDIANPGDIVIDGGNSDYQMSVKHNEDFNAKNIGFMDMGTSGGVDGARNGASFMVGGTKEDFAYVEPLLKGVSAEGGVLFAGETGSGHYAKMIHNAILYGMMQTIAEGFELLHASQFSYNLEELARSWSKSAVVRGWLMELTAQAFAGNNDLDGVTGIVSASKDAHRTLNSSFELNVPVPVISLSLMMRQRSQQEESFAGKVITSLRKEVGGHKPIK